MKEPMQPKVQSPDASQAAKALQAALKQAARRALGEAAPASLGRLEVFAERLTGARRVYHQEPMQLHYPGLAAIEFHDREAFPWLADLEAAAADIREELIAILRDDGDDLAPYVDFPKGAPLGPWAELNGSPRWGAFHLIFDGRVVAWNAKRAPKTMAALARLPQPWLPRRSPMATFSVLQPATRIPPHTGVTNTRLIVHLPLIVPGACGLRVGAETREWREGEALVFDDTIEHEAWNDSDEPRAILICDVWNPAVPEGERAAITARGRHGGYGRGGGEMTPIISVSGLTKVYGSGFRALEEINLDIRAGEIFALLGPNGAGKTTLISIICGIVNPTSGTVTADGHDIIRDYRAARSMIGLVPQELTTDAFETVWATVQFSRGLFGKPPNKAHLEKVLKDLSLWDKKDAKIMDLSGGMKRRVMIAKALSHEPRILFLDEPTAGVDVELRRDMWEMVRALRATGVTIILTTHYIDEAEEMADRIGVMNKGEIILVEDKDMLMRKLGKRQLTLHLQTPLGAVPEPLAAYELDLAAGGSELVYSFDAQSEGTGIAELMRQLSALGIDFKDLRTTESSLEDIFVSLVRARP